MNPELRRNLWLEFSLHRLLAMPAVIALVTLLVLALSERDGSRHIAIAAGFGFLALVMVWGTRNAADSVLEEARSRTWDAQRMSSIGPWAMTWGKLAGATAFTWYGGAMCVVLFVLAGSGRLEIPVLKTSVVMIAGAVLLHGMALNVGLLTAQKGLAGRASGALAYPVFAVVLLGPATGWVTEASGDVRWWGWQFRQIDFILASVIAFATWAAFGAYRTMCGELQLRTAPWALAAFLCFMAAYLAGFLAVAHQAALGGAEAVLVCGLGVSLAAAYALLFAERTGAMALRRLIARFERRQWRRALEELPGWPVAISLALLCAAGTALLDGAEPSAALREIRVASIALALFAMRDAALLHVFAFARQPKRIEAVTLLYLALLYWLVPALLEAAGAETLARLVLPNVFARPGSATAVMAVQAVLAVTIAAWRWRRNCRAPG